MKTILIIEDDTVLRETTAEILELENYKVVTAPNGKRGAEQARIMIPDLILCDIMMPEMDGYDLLKLLSQEEQTKRIPFIFMSFIEIILFEIYGRVIDLFFVILVLYFRGLFYIDNLAFLWRAVFYARFLLLVGLLKLFVFTQQGRTTRAFYLFSSVQFFKNLQIFSSFESPFMLIV